MTASFSLNYHVRREQMMTMLQKAAVKLGLPRNATQEQVIAAIDRRDGERRDALVAKAAKDGRIADTPANRKKWRDELDKNPTVAERVLASLAPVRLADPPPQVPVEEQLFSSEGLGRLWGFDRPTADRAPKLPPDDDTIDDAGEVVSAGWFRGVV